MKILYLSTIIGTIDSFLIPHLRLLSEQGHVVDVAGNFTTKISKELKTATKNCYNLPLQRNPLNINNINALKRLLILIKKNNYDLVHVHTPVASVIGRFACILTATKCFYTAHGFHFYKGAPLINWLIYFPIEWCLSFFTNTIITINKEDFNLAKKYMFAKNVDIMPGVGVDIEKFANVKIDKLVKRKELNIPENCKLILSVGELNKNKNHQVVIRALALLNDPTIHYAICGVGNLDNYLLRLAKTLGIDSQLHLLGRRDDIPEILKCSDLFIFPSIREGLGIAAIEAITSDLPIIVADNRGTRELSLANDDFILYDKYDYYSLSLKINKLLSEKELEKQMKDIRHSIINKFSIENVLRLLPSILKIY